MLTHGGAAAALDCLQNFMLPCTQGSDQMICSPPLFTFFCTGLFVYTVFGIHPWKDVIAVDFKECSKCVKLDLPNGCVVDILDPVVRAC